MLLTALWPPAAGVPRLKSHPKLAAVYPYFEKVRLPDATNFDIRWKPFLLHTGCAACCKRALETSKDTYRN
jgi:hypothetical protein